MAKPKSTAQAEPVQEDYLAPAMELIQSTDNIANPAMLVFPTDKWGLCRDLKKDLINLAGRLCGSKDKYILYKQILLILEAHVEAKYLRDGGTLDA